MTQAVTLKDIAKEAKLSIGAVSKALSGHSDASASTRDRVLAISDKLNYQPRRRWAAANRQARVAFVLCGMDGDGSQVTYRQYRIEKMTRFAAEKGIRLELSTVNSLADEVKNSSRTASSEPFDAIVLCGGSIDFPLLKKVDAMGLPWLSFGAPTGENSSDIDRGHLIVESMVEMGRSATESLIDAGHTNIGFVAGPRIIGGWNAGWLAGYQLAHIARGLPIDTTLIPTLEQNPPDQIGTRAADYFAGLAVAPSAWVVSTALGASRFVAGMAKHGQTVATDQLVCGCDGGELHILDELGLTGFPVIANNLDAECRLACELLRVMADGGCPTPARHYLPFQKLNFDQP